MSSTAWKTTSPKSTPTSAVRRRWSRRRSRCSSAKACPRPTSITTSSPPQRTIEETHGDRGQGTQRPQACVHRRRGGGQGVPLLAEPELQLLHASQTPRDGL